MAKPRFEGGSVDEALETAAKALGVERFRLSYHIVVEKRGFLGGIKRVVIEAEVNESLDVQTAPPAEDSPAAKSPGRPVSAKKVERDEKRDDTERAPRRPGGARGGSAEEGRPRGRRRGTRRKRSRRPESSEVKASVPAPDEKIPEQGPRSEDETKVAEWCETLFERAGLELVIRTEADPEQIRGRLYGRDVQDLIARGGELLDSVQVLANKALTGNVVDRRIELDTGDFKEQRENELGRKALELAATVRREGRERVMQAMTPIERRIVHLALQEEEGVETESRGNGFLKRLAIIPSPDGGQGPAGG